MAAVWRWLSDIWFFLGTFFPIKLLLLHLRRSHLLVIFWVVLFGFVLGFLGESYGFRYLFLSPEYQEEVNATSYFLLGFTLGLFTMAFHINSYIYYSYRFPFLATLSRPLWKFSLNNSIIPLLFYGTLSLSVFIFLQKEGFALAQVILYLAALLGGSVLSIGLTISYFIGTIKTLSTNGKEQFQANKGVKTLKALVNLGRKKYQVSASPKAVNYYLKNFYAVRLARSTSHYEKQIIEKNLDQHHLSAVVFFVILLGLIIGLGFVSDIAAFRIPAGATVFLVVSLYLMVVGAFYVRLKTWTVTVGFLLLLLVHFSSGRWFSLNENYAYGLNYSGTPAPYNAAVLDSLTADSLVQKDLASATATLNQWRAKFSPTEKPKLVIFNVSGGGLRSTLWTMNVMQTLDSVLGPSFYPQVQLITGSSGGMLGAAYYRELKYQQQILQTKLNPNAAIYRQQAAKDLLNATTFTLAVNDLLFRFKQVKQGGNSYPLDRGYSFDKRWLENTNGVLDFTFGRNTVLEKEAKMPSLLLAPTIVADGRKLLMATQPCSYLTFTQPFGVEGTKEFDAVEYTRLFSKQNPNELSFATALRLSASFPYITPLVSLPSQPPIQLIDAGVRDNEGLELALRYVHSLDNWIKANTAGVVIIQVKANRPDAETFENKPASLLEKLALPINGVVNSFGNLQSYNKALLLDWSKELLDFDVDVYRFSLIRKEANLSLSWHLTEAEKKEIVEAMQRSDNKLTLKQLQYKLKSRPLLK
jgi:hypothetical protein